MSEQLPSAAELFRHFRPRFEQVELIPLNLVHGHWMNATQEMNSVYLSIGRGGKPYQNRNVWCRLDLVKAGVKFDFTFDATKGTMSLWNELNKVARDAVQQQILKDRVFTLRAENPENIFIGMGTTINLTVEGDPILGLEDTRWTRCSDWELFVPKESAEGQAIEARLSLDYTTQQAASTPKFDVGAASEKFKSALQSVPA